MAQAKNRPPVELGGIRGGGYSADGDAISFTLEARDGRTFDFSLPHTAIGEVTSMLFALADHPAALRPADGPASGEQHLIKRTFPLQRHVVSGVPESGNLSLTLFARNIEH
jgi:hypothetical protein